ncbi:Segregation and condensation protein B [Actinomyces slackii]|uniref:Segregation and condensation protein B n=3 Tax=Actinomyces slackii TaxID=52774 RepID=A0A3S4SL06_9ACTO|nr:Segregation and condensation protein B [Actinomyces slackii]
MSQAPAHTDQASHSPRGTAQQAPQQAPQQAMVSAVAAPQLRSAAEAILIVADEPVTTAAMAEALGLQDSAADQLLEELAAEYRGEDSGSRPRGFVLRRAAGGWRLASAPEHADLVEAFVIGGATARLSQAALETLAVIAYRQPVTRGRVAAIRGVNVDGVVRTLHARGLIEETGTEPSGAILYRTTAEFLEYLGIDSLEDLPPLAPYLPGPEALGDLHEELTDRSMR